MKCPQCDFENEEGSKFCKNCNVPLSKQDYSEDNPYIKKKGNEEQPFELISNEEEKEETKINMIKKIWKDLFHSSEAEGLSIASKEDIEEIIDMLIADKIDPQIFISNLEALLRGGMPSFNDFLGTEEKPKTSKSISSFTFVVNRPMGTPLWFLAGYPDVMNWFNDQEEKHIKSHNRDYDDWETEIAKLWGLDTEDKNINENQIMNSDGKLHPKYCNNLKKHYKETTKKKLEVSVDENSDNNIYLGAELLNMMGAESNFTLIAENTTKYYLELTKNYKNRFNNEVFLLATAGILDAQFYIFMDKTINPAEIIDIAKKAVSSGKDALINFIIKLEIKLFKIDSPAMDISAIENVCIEQKVAILKTIQKTKEKYNSEPRVASEVEVFMNSIKFKPYRKMLGIKNKFLFF
ncbi:MAG: zinc ribbon domain-containing protein [Actinobacteria bacterium]|nr:zinc ribbon domain-containing protein [Actinomycetota bacterium]